MTQTGRQYVALFTQRALRVLVAVRGGALARLWLEPGSGAVRCPRLSLGMWSNGRIGLRGGCR